MRLLPRLLLTTALLALSCCASNPPATQPPPSSETTASPPPPSDGIFSTWVELVPEQKGSPQMARVITANPLCPALTFTNAQGATTQLSMQVRAASEPGAFPVTSCEVLIPSSARHAQVLTHVLPLLPRNPRRIVVIGDTGCRIKGKAIQACNDPEQWPFSVATKAAAEWKPDLVIHVGDYYYRESPCPAGDKGCAGAHSGDHWEPWREDFFAPAAPLLEAAPWILTRGNHEDCSRGGAGWDRFLEARPYAECRNDMPPFAVPVGDHRVWVVDSAIEENVAPSLKEVREKTALEPSRLSWLITHRPLLRPERVKEAPKTDAKPNHANKKASGIHVRLEDLPPELQLILVGHIHELSINRFHDRRPPELVTGNGGTQLDTPPAEFATPASGDTAFHETHTADFDATSRWQFGFITFERQKKRRWKIAEHDRTGAEVLTCEFREDPHGTGQIDCPAIHPTQTR
jgi:hypothetical protein